MLENISVGFTIGFMLMCALIIFACILVFSSLVVGKRADQLPKPQQRRFTSAGERAFHDLAERLYEQYTADGKVIRPQMYTSREEEALRRWAEKHPTQLDYKAMDDLVNRMDRLTHPDDYVNGEWREVK